MSSTKDAAACTAAICSIATAWGKYEGKTVPQGPLANRLATFPRLDEAGLRACIHRASNDWVNPGSFLMGAPVAVGSPHLFPAALFLFRNAGNELELSVRVAAFFSHDGKAHYRGWRYELADAKPHGGKKTRPGENPGRAHHFPHVQHITSWTLNGPQGLWYDNFRPRVESNAVHEIEASSGPNNESRPAFPLNCSSSPGLLICVLASLYGSTITDEILEAAMQLPGWLRKEADQITGR